LLHSEYRNNRYSTTQYGPRKYIMSSPILTNPGTYKMELIDKERVRQELIEYKYISTIDKFSLVAAFNTAINPEKHITMNRMFVKMNVRDKAIIFRLKRKITDDMNGPNLKSFIKNNFECYMLERLE
jgi:hypothetical protein